MKSVLISIRPEWCGKIANGEKTIEVRKTRPKIDIPFKCYIYCTLGKYDLFYNANTDLSAKEYIESGVLLNGKVIGEFVCDLITGLKANDGIQAYYNNTKETCLTDKEIIKYAKGKMVYYWHISDLVIYDEPKELSEFGIKRPPQSWQYIDEVIDNG